MSSVGVEIARIMLLAEIERQRQQKAAAGSLAKVSPAAAGTDATAKAARQGESTTSPAAPQTGGRQ